MQTVRIEGPAQISLVETDIPEPGPGEVLIEVAWAGVCHTDIEILQGTHGAYASGWAHYPVVPGHEWSGWVREIGAGVTGFEPGELVTGETGIGCGHCKLCRKGAYNCCPDVMETGIINRDGGMRQFHVQPASHTHKLGRMTPEHGALVEPASVGVYACKRAGVGPGDKVAVCGGGSIGQLCAQAAHALGAEMVVLTSRSQSKLDLAVQLGAHRAIDVGKQDLMAEAQEITGGELFDVTIEAAGAAEALDDAMRLAATRGRVAVVGYAESTPYAHSLAKVIGVELTVIGVRGSPGVWRETTELIEAGQIQVGPMVSHRFGLHDYAEAFATAQRGGPDVLKVLLSVQASA